MLNSESRLEFVGEVMSELVSGFHDSFFLLISNDNRAWDNHPSDTDFSNMASQWFYANGKADRFLMLSDEVGYRGNIGVLSAVDFIVTGRMHLSLAAFQPGTLPFVLMGEGKGYSSVDKMFGAFEKSMGTSLPVVTEIGTLKSGIQKVLADRTAIAQNMATAAERRASDCDAAKRRFSGYLRNGVSARQFSQSESEAAASSAFVVILRQEEAIRSAEVRLVRIMAELKHARDTVQVLEESRLQVFQDTELRLAGTKVDAELRIAEATLTTERRLADARQEVELRLAGAKLDAELRLAAAEHVAERRLADAEHKAELCVAEIESDTKLRVAEIESAAELRVAEIEGAARHRVAELEAFLEARDRATSLAEAKGIADLQAALSRVGECEYAAAVLTSYRSVMSEELRRTYARPWRPLKRGLHRVGLRFALLVPSPFSDRTVSRLQQSLAKRSPSYFISD